MQLFQFIQFTADQFKSCWVVVPVYAAILVAFSVYAIRKFAYHLYAWFPNAVRIHEFLWKRKVDYYWSGRADLSPAKLFRLYLLWFLVRLDKYFPFIDCERQAAKAQYFHTSGRYVGMGAFHYRCINPEAWPVFLVRRFITAFFPSLLSPSENQVQK